MAVFQTRVKNYSRLLPEEIQEISKGIFENMSEDEKNFAISLLNDMDNGHFESMIRYEMIDYEKPVIGVREWLNNEYYTGEDGKKLYDVWKSDLIELFESKIYNTAILTGSQGSGKSTFAQYAILRMLYEASCLKNPSKTYGLGESSKIAFCFLAPSAEVVKRVVSEGLVEKFKKIPYFSEEFSPIQKLRKQTVSANEIAFPKLISLCFGSSSDNSILGQNIVGGFVDELNFFQKMSKEKQRLGVVSDRFGMDEKAGKLFDSIMRRIKSRFSSLGKLPGILIGASSKTSEDALTERIIRQAIENKDPTLFVRDRSILDVKSSNYSKSKFKIFIGGDMVRPKILNEGEENDYDPDSIISVPEDFRREFENNLESSLRDLAGISTNAVSVFISDSEKIKKCIDEERKHPFKCFSQADIGEWDSRSPYSIDWGLLCKRQDDGSWIPKLNPDRQRVIHLDPGLTGDAFALAMSHISGTRRIESQKSEDSIIEEEPMFVCDFILRIKGEPGSEVLLKNVRKIIYELSEHGFSIAKITTDTYQSREMIQNLKSQGFDARILSVDTHKDPYKYLRRIINEGRISFYKYKALIEELSRLEEHTDKIDHSPGFRKDCSDALCGTVWNLFEMGEFGMTVQIISGENTEKESDLLKKEQLLEINESKNNSVKKIKTISPSFKKRDADGNVTEQSNRTLDLPIIEFF